MNKYEELAGRQRNASLRSGTSVWTAGLALIVVILVILGFQSSAPSDYFYKGAIGVAILFLLLRPVIKAHKVKDAACRPAGPEVNSKTFMRRENPDGYNLQENY